MSGWLVVTVSVWSLQGLVVGGLAHGSAIILSSGESSSDELGRCDEALMVDAAAGVFFVCGCETKRSVTDKCLIILMHCFAKQLVKMASVTVSVHQQPIIIRTLMTRILKRHKLSYSCIPIECSLSIITTQVLNKYSTSE